jgi:hypothetical protein
MTDTDNPLRYFELLEEHGVDYAGNLEPIADIGLAIPTQVLVPAEVGSQRAVSAASHVVRIEPAQSLGKNVLARAMTDTRIVETAHPLVASTLLSTQLFREIEKPSKTVLDKHIARTRQHHEAMSKRGQQVDAGHEQAPDANDNPEG